MSDIIFELNSLDEQGRYFDNVGEYTNLEDARKAREMYLPENPDEKYEIVKVTREFVE